MATSTGNARATAHTACCSAFVEGAAMQVSKGHATALRDLPRIVSGVHWTRGLFTLGSGSQSGCGQH